MRSLDIDWTLDIWQKKILLQSGSPQFVPTCSNKRRTLISKVCVKNENFTFSPKVMLKNWFMFKIISSSNEDIISNILFDIISSLNEDIISNMNQFFNVIFEGSAKFSFLIHTVILKFIIFLLHVKIVEIH
jgi:hypothetical protein